MSEMPTNLEVNRFPGFLGFEKLTKYNVIKDFVKYFTRLKKPAILYLELVLNYLK